MAKVRKRTWTKKDGSKSQCWIIDFVDPSGKRVNSGNYKTKAEAEIALAKMLTSVQEGTYSKQDKTLTFARAADDFLKYHANIHCKPSTLKSYKAYLKNHIIPFMGKRKLVDITPNKINEFIGLKLQDGLSNKSINHCVVLIGSIFQKIIDEGVLIQNPVKKVKRLKLPYQEMRFLETSEVHVILNTAKDFYPDFYPLLLMAITTGMRRGELLGLTWDKINWQTRKIHVTQSLYNGQLASPKTHNSIRKIDISAKLYDALKEWKEICPKGSKNLVFPNSVGEFMDADNMIKRRFHYTLTLAGIDKIRFHDLRHTYASILIAQNVPIKYIQNQMGHSSIQVTMDRYGHLMPEVYQQGIEALDNLFKD